MPQPDKGPDNKLNRVTGLTVVPASVDDLPTIAALAVDNGMFSVEEARALLSELKAAVAGESDERTVLVARSPTEPVVAAAYAAAEPFADRVWNLLFIATAPAAHGTGAGTALVGALEAQLRADGRGHTLVVDTSSTDAYAGARRFYLNLGFVEEARVRNWFGDGDDKVTYWKSLRTP